VQVPPATGGAAPRDGAAGARPRDRDTLAAVGLVGRIPPLPWLRRHLLVADLLVALVYLVLELASLNPHTRVSAPRSADAGAYVLVSISTVALALRRRSPVGVLAVVVVATTVFNFLGYPQGPSTLAVAFLLGVVAVYEPRSVSVPMLAFGGVAALGNGFGHFVGNAVVFVAGWALGDNVRTRRAYVAELEARAAWLEAEREEQARAAVRAERARIARELHDVVAHHVSVMVVQAGGARRLVERRPEQARDALTTIEETGRDALTAMRRLLGMLREAAPEEDARRPQPSIGELGRLVTQMHDAGLDVELTVEGEADDVPAAVDLSVYRIVQEALTNTLKHAGPARARVRVRYGDHRVDVGVVDDGRGAAAVAAGADGNESGHGLVGMRERVAIFGGDIRTGPRPGGGFAVHATLPWKGAPER
jgi:signal transduction histidine kinase